MPATSAATEHPTRLVLERTFAASPQRVWSAWTDPRELSRWFGPQGVEVAAAEVDLRVGGGFRVTMRAPDGERHCVAGRYRVVEPPRRLVFTWAWQSTPQRQSLVTVELAAADAGTRLTLAHERFADHEATERHREGWTSALEQLTRALQ